MPILGVDQNDFFPPELVVTAAISITGGISYQAEGVFDKEPLDLTLGDGIQTHELTFTPPIVTGKQSF